MTASMRIISPRIKDIKKLHVRSVDRIVQEHNKTEHPSDKPVIQIVPDIQTQEHLQQFKDWCMPEQSTGYLKASHNDLL